MADEDEIDVLGDFSFNSCFALNNQGIPSCSDREDTVHPQWLLDSTATNWYDTQIKGSNRSKDGPSRKLSGNNASKQQIAESHTTWSQAERTLLKKEMEKYGRNIQKISHTLKTKTEAEIQALIEAEYGVNLETPVFGLPKHEEYDNIPAVVQEEVVMDDVMNIRDTLSMVTTAYPTIPVARKAFKNKNFNVKSKNSLLKPNILNIKNPDLIAINPSEIFYEDELIIGSTESIGSETDLTDAVSTNLLKQHKERIKSGRKIGNHRRKVPRKYDRSNVRSKNTELMKSPKGRQRIDSGLSEDSEKSPKLQIVLGSGQALPVSEGEQVIKIEKKKDSEPESDIEIDIDSDKEENRNRKPPEEPIETTSVKEEVPIAIPLRKFEPMPKRRKKINLDGGGGCTIMHTAAGDLYEVAAEPRRERIPKKAPIQLIRCHVYNTDKPPPCEVSLNVSALIAMDTHGHTSRGEVMGLVGGVVTHYDTPGPGLHLLIASYCRAAAANARTHCDMDPVSQARAAEILRARRLVVCGWHHSHPSFPGAPSAVDLRTQLALQAALERDAPFLALITSQHWPPGRDASHYRCIHVEEDASYSDGDTPVGYQLSVKLVPDLTEENLRPFLLELRGILLNDADRNELSVDLPKDLCPQAGITYLEKFPKTEEDWKDIAKTFEDRWNFPHCIGSIDGKHIDIIPPSESGSYYYNYKGRHSMVLLAIVDAKYRFIMCDFGTNGRVSDGGVLQNTVFYKKLEKNLLKIPVEEKINNSLKLLPYVFVTDDAFPLRCDMMKPFRQADLNSQDRKIFNYRLSRARRIVENAFGILAARFRIFHTQINIEPNNIESVVMASCALHNFLIAHSRNHYSPSECFDQENAENGTILPGLHAGDHMIPLNRRGYGNTALNAKNIREQFMDYFSNEGSVPWQNNFIN